MPMEKVWNYYVYPYPPMCTEKIYQNSHQTRFDSRSFNVWSYGGGDIVRQIDLFSG